MEKYIYKIKIDDFRAKIPLTYPSIDNNGVATYYNPASSHCPINAHYNLIPLNVSEEICGPYSGYTPEMADSYSGTVLTYTTLKEWLKEFTDYYNLLHGTDCRVPYTSASEYSDEDAYKDMDERHLQHGGDKFYKWLTEYYCPIIDLRLECPEELEYQEWTDYIDNLPSYTMYYTAVRQLYAKVSEWDRLYYNQECAKYETCCDCVDYKNIGGHYLVTVLRNWLNRVNVNIVEINNIISDLNPKHFDNLIPSLGLRTQMQSKLENFGDYAIFSKEFIPGHDYTSGTVTTYEDIVYINTGDTYCSQEFDVTKWVSYKDFLNIQTETSDLILSGRTDSSLDSFLTNEMTVDNMGNSLPGSFVPNSGSTVVQPAENTMLGLKYEIGKCSNVKKIDEGVFFGDFLYEINLYMKYTSGGTAVSGTCIQGDDAIDTIEDMLNTASGLENVDDTIYADFISYRGSTFRISDGIVVPDNIEMGIKCIDHCTLEENIYPYYLSPSKSYPVRYYKVTRPYEEVYSSDYRQEVNVYLCDFYFKPNLYDKPDEIASPMLRKEELLGFNGPENIENNIYIDRGYVTVLDKHLRIGEITDFDDIKNYGNGMFKLLDANADIV